MKKTRNIKLSLVFLVTVVVISLSVLVAFATQTETPVSNITTFFHESTGTLIVSGTGEIKELYPRQTEDYGDDGYYYGDIISYDDTVKHIIIDEGITSVSNSFNDMKSLKTITLPQTLEKISFSFMACPELKSVDFPESVKEIVSSSFNDCTGLTDIHFSNKINLSGGDYGTVFGGCTSLKQLYIPGGSTLERAFSRCLGLEKVVLGTPDVTLVPGDYSGDFYLSAPNFAYVENLVVVTAKENINGGLDSSVDVAELPVLPQKITMTTANKGIEVDWDAVATVDTYHLYRRTKGSSTWELLADVKASEYYDDTVESGKQYAYLVKTDDNSGYTATSWFEFIEAPDLISANNTVNGVKISWKKAEGAVKYRVYRLRTGTYMDQVGNYSGYDWELVSDVTGTTCIDTKPDAGGIYRYTVRAYGKSVKSGVIKPGLECMFVPTPKVNSVANTSEGVKITWKLPYDGFAQTYFVYRREPGGSWQRIARIIYEDVNTFTDKTAESGKTYEYTVRANIYGVWSSSYYSGKSIVRLDTPELSSASSTKNGVVLKWNAVDGAKGYRIYRKSGKSSWELIKIAEGGSIESYTDKTAKKGTTYTYTVRAYNGKIYSDFNRTGISVKDKY